ncbi:pentapeptide repeat-containing protein [Polaromonas naphthalenivorans]|uniref:Pentapeptide repeat protein n=1 Tax=Polaromonas naphthalenivorans (strain CJ2) TaxID=365044 RepID=A1VPY8_POLNA|nr:pentapeptide repeat-containing protein [Polaromonas naphthalenivorans]ABM37716.1 pentapeptide repeat protein [Polaromonas naphthalenivorans CJ2]
MTRSAAGFMLIVCLVLASSCGGGSDASAPAPAEADPVQTASTAVAKINAAQGVLELPLLQSGAALYADVRIRFSLDGNFELLSWRPVTSAVAPVDADLQPQVALADLQRSSQPLKLNIRRLHMDAAVYEAVSVELQNGRWRYPQPLVPATTLTSKDLRANPALFARDDHLVVMESSPGRSEEFSLRLEARRYRFCMDPQDEGADSITLLDASGASLLTIKAGGPCATLQAEQGLYRIRQRYGGTGASRTMFMRRQPAGQAVLTQPPGSQPPLKDAGVEEYWGILASFIDPTTQKASSSGFLGLSGWRPGGPEFPDIQGCVGYIHASVQSLKANHTNSYSASTLLDGLNFFKRINDSQGNPTQLGAPLSCNGGLVGLEASPTLAVALIASGDVLRLTGTIQIDSFSTATNAFILKSVRDGFASQAMGFPYGVNGMVPNRPEELGVLVTLTPDQIAQYQPEYRTVLRYRPGGFAGSSLPGQGQVALFNTQDCSGAAMVVDHYDLPGIMPGGPLGNFDGSLKLGTLTTATVYSAMSQQGEQQHLNRSGCIASGWGSAGWKAASIAINVDTIEMVLSDKKCEQCNLSGIDLTGRSMPDVKLYGANLNNAHLAGSDLSGADLRYASLQGAQLPNANLDAANLCAANLNAAPSTAGVSNVAANLTGAYLRNASLYGSNMAGANFSNASFYSTSQAACQPSDCGAYQKPACANAYGAKLDSAKFSSAYLVGVDMSNVAGSAADFSNAVLNGASFRNATLTPDFNGTPANFSNAFLQGADFTGANLVNPIFTNAYGDANPNGGCMQFELGASYTSFPGFAVPTTPPPSTACVRSAPVQTCVQFTYNKPTLGLVLDPPATPLSQARPKNTSCFAEAPLCGDPFIGVGPNTCWSP